MFWALSFQSFAGSGCEKEDIDVPELGVHLSGLGIQGLSGNFRCSEGKCWRRREVEGASGHVRILDWLHHRGFHDYALHKK